MTDINQCFPCHDWAPQCGTHINLNLAGTVSLLTDVQNNHLVYVWCESDFKLPSQWKIKCFSLFHIKCFAFLLQTDSCLKTTPLVDHFLKSWTINSNNCESFLNPQQDSLGIHNLFFWSVLFFRYFFHLF